MNGVLLVIGSLQFLDILLSLTPHNLQSLDGVLK